ncbi:MAG: hypothetical protein DRO62_00565 [Candidatus Altiarchaeales archaeon]|nr:MAG: hypothetical protein DRO62_00565 [Candidatus Altiarchaeales archaeon]
MVHSEESIYSAMRGIYNMMNRFLLGILIYVLSIIVSILAYSLFLWLSTKIMGFDTREFRSALNVTLPYALIWYILSRGLGFIVLFVSLTLIVPTLGPTAAFIIFVSTVFLVYAVFGISLVNKEYGEGTIKSFLAWLMASIMMSVLITIMYMIMPAIIGIKVELYLGLDLLDYKKFLLSMWERI